MFKKGSQRKRASPSPRGESQNQIMGSKCQSTVVFTKDEEFIAPKKQCKGFIGVSSDQNLLEVAAR